MFSILFAAFIGPLPLRILLFFWPPVPGTLLLVAITLIRLLLRIVRAIAQSRSSAPDLRSDIIADGRGAKIGLDQFIRLCRAVFATVPSRRLARSAAGKVVNKAAVPGIRWSSSNGW
ncbi:MAG: hypothetical protein RQ741_02130 [Wenzhouxiangellaceae bacterium]|nr:hypothetical protein [Wenzhouxiangellaceae bacterium]